jgi:MtN3 and saliva related transmembrane protein
MELLGFVAAFLTTVAFIPQVVKVYKTNKTSDLSLLTFSMFTSGMFLWMIYGFMIESYPVIMANVLTFIFALYILLKIIGNLKLQKSD